VGVRGDMFEIPAVGDDVNNSLVVSGIQRIGTP